MRRARGPSFAKLTPGPSERFSLASAATSGGGPTFGVAGTGSVGTGAELHVSGTAMTRDEHREPNLLRTWAVQSISIASIAAVLVYFGVGWIARAQEYGLAGDLAARASDHVFRELEVRWLPNHQDSLVPANDAEFDELEALFALHRNSLKVPRIVWFDPDHRIIHCGVRNLAGMPAADDDALLSVGESRRVIHLIEPGSRIHLDGARFDVPLLEVYVRAPADVDPRLRNHIVELYLDATEIVGRVESFRRWVLIGALVVGAALFAVVLRLVQLAQRRLGEQNERLRALSEGLERDVEARTQELIRTRRLADVGTLAAGLAHEINNPLAVIAASAQGLLDRMRRRPDALQAERGDFEEYLRAIESETFRCKRITESLLSFSRSRPAALRRVDLREVVAEVASLLRPLAAARQQEIRVVPGDMELPVDAAPEELKQVLVNLITNAFDAGKPGKTVELACARTGDDAVVTVRDRGRGFGDLKPEQLFEPFFTTKPPGEGVGMGLPVSRHIAELHGGQLVAEVPADGIGASFRCTLPLAHRAAPNPVEAR